MEILSLSEMEHPLRSFKQMQQHGSVRTSTTGSVQTLYNNLVAFWPLDQASSLNRIDSYGFHSITGGGGLSSTPGKTRIIASGFSTAYLASSNQPEADANLILDLIVLHLQRG